MNSKKINKSQLINMLLNLSTQLAAQAPVPAPRKSVKQRVKQYEDHPPSEFRDSPGIAQFLRRELGEQDQFHFQGLG